MDSVTGTRPQQKREKKERSEDWSASNHYLSIHLCSAPFGLNIKYSVGRRLSHMLHFLILIEALLVRISDQNLFVDIMNFCNWRNISLFSSNVKCSLPYKRFSVRGGIFMFVSNSLRCCWYNGQCSRKWVTVSWAPQVQSGELTIFFLYRS